MLNYWRITHPCSVTHNINTYANKLNNGWDFQWKTNWNPNSGKQTQEVIFCQISKKISHLPLFFNNIQVSQSSYQKHLGINLDEQLAFSKHLKMLTSKINKTVVLLQKLQKFLPRSALTNIYSAYVRPHLDYGDIIYGKASYGSFHRKLELSQYNACLAITGFIRGTTKKSFTNS